jgi:hypothetical protein
VDTYLYTRERLQLVVISSDEKDIEQSLLIWSKHFQIGLECAINEYGINIETIMPSA